MAILPAYNISFDGYKMDRNVDKLPTYSGIYMIYRGIYDEENNTVELKELFYIGKATDIHQEVHYHNRRAEFLKQAEIGEEICYAYAQVSRVQYDIIENSLVFMQKPRLNTELVNHYNHQNAEFHFNGTCNLLDYVDYQIINEVIISL